jgi:hypothetical protein
VGEDRGVFWRATRPLSDGNGNPPPGWGNPFQEGRLAFERVPGLRAVAIAGPSIDPATLPVVEGLEVRGYVHELYRHLRRS